MRSINAIWRVQYASLLLNAIGAIAIVALVVPHGGVDAESTEIDIGEVVPGMVGESDIYFVNRSSSSEYIIPSESTNSGAFRTDGAILMMPGERSAITVAWKVRDNVRLGEVKWMFVIKATDGKESRVQIVGHVRATGGGA